MAITYTDWQISKIHAEKIDDLHIRSMPKAKLQKRIPGIGSKLTDGRIKPGVWLQPIGAELGRQFSSVQDKGRGTLVLLASGGSSNKAIDEPSIFDWREQIVNLFNRKRITGLVGENYTRVLAAPFDLDDDLARTMDIVALNVISWFREDRV